MPDLFSEYRALASSLDPLIQQLVNAGRSQAAMDVGAAQGQLRSAAVTIAAVDIQNALDTSGDPQAAKAAQALENVTQAMSQKAAQLAKDQAHVATIVGIATSGVHLAASFSPLNIPGLLGACNDIITALQ